MASSIPDLPILATDDSMLSRKFGREVANYFSGNPLNRVSFLRADHAFLSSAFTHPSTSFLLLENSSPSVKDSSSLAYLTKSDIEPLTGSDFFEKTEDEWVKNFNSSVARPVVLFLGLDEKQKSGFEYKEYKGTPYFAIDVTPKGDLAEKAKSVVEAVKAKGITFLPGARPLLTLKAPEGEGYTARNRSFH